MVQEDALQAYYGLGKEQGRLGGGLGVVEFARTQELLLRHLPRTPATVADIGGGPGRYALWLASLGYTVLLRDVVPLHVEQAVAAAAEAGTAIGVVCTTTSPREGGPNARLSHNLPGWLLADTL